MPLRSIGKKSAKQHDIRCSMFDRQLNFSRKQNRENKQTMYRNSSRTSMHKTGKFQNAFEHNRKGKR